MFSNLSPTSIAELTKFAAWASKKENWYDIDSMMIGKISFFEDDSRYVKQLENTRFVFSYTNAMSENKIFRHLLIIVDDLDKMPSTSAIVEIAKVMGFTGNPSKDWSMGPSYTSLKKGIVIQEIPYSE